MSKNQPPHSPKLDRKLLKTPDEFVKRGTAVVDVIYQQRNWVIPALGVLLVVALGWYGWSWWNGRQLVETWQVVETAQKQPEPQRWDELKNVFEKHGKNRATLYAVVALADHYFEDAKKKAANEATASAEMAADWYSKAIGFNILTPMEKQLLLVNRGETYTLQKKYDDAIYDFDEAIGMGGSLKAYSLLEKGLVFELKGEFDKAKEVYEKVSQEFFSSEYGKMAKNYIRRLKNPALNPSATQQKG